jgi:hypothetical protein
LASAKVFVLIEAIDHSLWPSGVEMLLETQGAVALVPLYLKLHPKSKICIVVTNELIQTVIFVEILPGSKAVEVFKQESGRLFAFLAAGTCPTPPDLSRCSASLEIAFWV